MTGLVTGVVLAGGRSSRFGSDKAVAQWQGTTLTASGVSVLSRVFSRVLVVGKNNHFAVGLPRSARFVKDGSNFHHPLEGIIAALREAETDRIFVTACDMPLAQPALIRAICASGAGYAAAAPIWGERPQPLFAVYSKECLGVLRLLLQEHRPIKELFEIVRTRFLSPEEVDELDPSGRSFLDIDTQEDYVRVRRLAHA